MSLKSKLNPAQISFVESKIKAAEAARSKGVSPSMLAKLRMIDEHLAEGAIDQNTQLCRHNADNYLSRRYTTNDQMIRYKRLKSKFYFDTMFATKHKSVREYTCCQIFVSDKGFVAKYPMRSQEEFRTALH